VPAPNRAGLPVRPFLYTIDQIASILALDLHQTKRYLWLKDRSVGPQPRDRIFAINIAPEGELPEWRVAERELIRWLRHQGFRVYDRSWQ
jgi:hypothetical protein